MLVCAAILVARRPAQLRNPQLWAEEGTIWYAEAHTMGARALLRSFGGYLDTTQRVVAALLSGRIRRGCPRSS